MAQGIHGGDPAAMDKLAGKADHTSATILAIRTILDGIRDDAPVYGKLANKMATEFESQLLPQLKQSEDALTKISEVLTWNAREQRHASDSTASPPTGPKPEYQTPPTKQLNAPKGICQVTDGPRYSYTGAPKDPVTSSLGLPQSKKYLEMWAKFSKEPGHDPSCCKVQQYLTWDHTFHDAWGPPHSGFKPPEDKPGVAHEDKNQYGDSYGDRNRSIDSTEYYTDGKPDPKGDTFYSSDDPGVPSGTPGKWTFQLKVVDTCQGDIPVASSEPVTIDWKENSITPPPLAPRPPWSSELAEHLKPGWGKQANEK